MSGNAGWGPEYDDGSQQNDPAREPYAPGVPGEPYQQQGYPQYGQQQDQPYGQQYEQQPGQQYDTYGGQPAYQDPAQAVPQYPQQPQQPYGQPDYGQQQPPPMSPQQGYPQDPYAVDYPQPQAPQVPQEPQLPQQPQQFGYDTGQFDTGQFQTMQFEAGQLTAEQFQRSQQEPSVPQQREHFEQPGIPDAPDDRVYETGQFQFVKEETEQSDDAIDWLKFVETRTERRDDKKRKTKGRVRLLAIALVLGLLVGGGYYFLTKDDAGADGGGGAAGAAGKRDVIVVHLYEKSGRTSNILLVDNPGSGRGSTVLLPENLQVSSDETGTVPLGDSLAQQGPSPTRDGLSDVLGAKIAGSWRLDWSYLKVLVDKVGGIDLKVDGEVREGNDPKGKVVLKSGKNSGVKGNAAVDYATRQNKGESADDRLARFGEVMNAVLEKMPKDEAKSIEIVSSLGSVADPSLPDSELGGALATLADHAQADKYSTVKMPVQKDGSLEEKSAGKVVEDVLGGAVKKLDVDDAARIAVRNASGNKKLPGQAQADITNGGYTYVPGGGKDQPTRPKSTVAYENDEDKKIAEEVAVTLGLPKSAAVKSEQNLTSDILVTVGQDYKG